MFPQIDEIVNALWEPGVNKKYLGQIIRVRGKEYDVFFMDGDSRNDVPENEIFKISKTQANDKLIGAKFFDEGDYEPGVRRTPTDFNKGEFTVLARNGRKSSYWCERETFGGEERCIELFGYEWISKLIEEYEKE